MNKKTSNLLVKEKFTTLNTDQFLIELDAVLKTINFEKVQNLIFKYKIQDDPECKIFLKSIHDIFTVWRINGSNSILVEKTETRTTKCYACFLGKKVKAYKFFYQIKKINEHKTRITYFKEFAIFTELKNNCIVDFGVCNGFLNKSELKKI